MTSSSKVDLDRIREYYRTVGPFMDLELANRHDGPFWASLVREDGHPDVLELGAGTGRATVHLQRSARTLVALDVVRLSLDRARDRLHGRGRVSLLVGDIRAIPLRAEFDLIVAANDPLVHMSEDADRDRALAQVSTHLRIGGRFVLDAHWLPLSARREAERPDGRSRTRPLGDPDDELVVREVWRCDMRTMRCDGHYEYLRAGKLVGEADFSGRIWSSNEIQDRLNRAGLEIRSVWGSYDRDPWDHATSRRLVVEAVKAREELTSDP